MTQIPVDIGHGPSGFQVLVHRHPVFVQRETVKSTAAGPLRIVGDQQTDFFARVNARTSRFTSSFCLGCGLFLGFPLFFLVLLGLSRSSLLFFGCFDFVGLCLFSSSFLVFGLLGLCCLLVFRFLLQAISFSLSFRCVLLLSRSFLVIRHNNSPCLSFDT